MISLINIHAQETEHHDHNDHQHEEHMHLAHKNELAVAGTFVHFPDENETAFGMHLHYIRNIANLKFGVGAGFERILDDHGHNTIGLILSYRPVHALSLNLTPAVLFEDKAADYRAALHFEIAYEFIAGPLHLGPIIDFGIDKEDYHVSAGLHMGFGF